MQSPQTSHNDGFTLVELLIVIVILGILSTVTVFAVSGLTDRGTDSACAADRKQFESAEEASLAQSGAYVTEADLVSGGFLRSESSNVDVTLASGSYTVVDAGQCASTPVGPTGPVAGSFSGLTSLVLGSGPNLIVMVGFGGGDVAAQDSFADVVAAGVTAGATVVFVEGAPIEPALVDIAAIAPTAILWEFGGDFAANAVSRFNMSLLVPATFVMTNPGDSLAYLQGQGYVNP